MKKGIFSKGILLSLAFVLVAISLAACGGKNNASPSPSASPSGSAPASQSPSASPSGEPGKLEKVRVSLWERSNSPDGTNILDTVIIKKLQEEAKKEGLDVEYVVLPRSQEAEKNNLWMASGEGPDILLSYDVNSMQRWAEQGGLWELDELLEQYGQDYKALAEDALSQIGMYKGKRYALPAQRMSTSAGANMKIRKDWLDKLGLPIPQTVEELYTTLKAFKEQDPGGVGKNNVIPWALPAINQGAKGFFFGPMFAFGVNADGPGSEMYWPSGNFKDGEFHSPAMLEEAKNYFEFMNKVYKEGLLSKEFVTDVNSQQFEQHIVSGVAGFIDSNDTPWQLIEKTRQTVSDAVWVAVPAFERPDGSRVAPKSASYGLLNLVPKSSKNPEAAVKYINFLAKNKELVQSGIEGEHYKVENGLRVGIDAEKNKKEISWYIGDTNLITQGYMGDPTVEQMITMYADRPEKELMAEVLDGYYKGFQQYGVASPTIVAQRPVAEKNLANLTKFMYEAISKVVIANDFESEWAKVAEGWKKNGGEEYDKEIGAILTEMGYVSGFSK